MAQNPYVHLGWNPVLLGESSFWEGDAAVGFREALDGDLPKYMKDAHTSPTKAAGHLGAWHGGLTGRRELASKYDVAPRPWVPGRTTAT
ncbi:hypothetical protein [Streptomyces sp. NPDC056479]|uniref:hypothetical protein n=1 Tax=unclassified Streptomyces TaxID=2593676 RepID=UPI00367E4164